MIHPFKVGDIVEVGAGAPFIGDGSKIRRVTNTWWLGNRPMVDLAGKDRLRPAILATWCRLASAVDRLADVKEEAVDA